MKKPIIILLYITVAFAIYMSGILSYISVDSLKIYRNQMQSFVSDHLMWAILMYVMVYIVAVAMAFPGAALITLTGGFLFGALLGAALTVFSATVGASILFTLVQTTFGENLRKKAGPWVQKFSDGFNENSFHYLLTFRLVPIFPFFIVNLVPAILGMKITPYVIATFIGIIPGTYVYCSFGSGIGHALDLGQDISLTGILTPNMIFSLCLLGALSILPVLYKKFRSSRN